MHAKVRTKPKKDLSREHQSPAHRPFACVVCFADLWRNRRHRYGVAPIYGAVPETDE